jgi:hypothetical protein
MAHIREAMTIVVRNLLHGVPGHAYSSSPFERHAVRAKGLAHSLMFSVSPDFQPE